MAMTALHSIRLRRALSLSYSVLVHSSRGYKTQPLSSISNSRLLPAPAATTRLMQRTFTSTTSLFRRAFDSDPDEVGPDTLFEGCDYKHWLITVDFSRDYNVSREQMIDTYVSIAAQVFGSVQEAMKRIYALSTTTYQGFQVECPEEISVKFKSVPQVVFVLPDSYIDPVNKEYGGDKYVNGEIYPRSPPVQYGSRSNRGMQLGEQNYGLPSQQNGPPPRNNYRPPPPPQQNQQNQQNYGPASQQNYGLSLQQNYRTLQQGYTPQPHQSYRSPPLKSYMPKTQGSYGNSPNIPIYPDNTTGHDGQRGFMQDANYRSSQDGPFGLEPSYQGNLNRAQLESDSAQGQGKLQSHARPGEWGLTREANYRSTQDGPFGQAPSYQGNFNRAELESDFVQGHGKLQSHARPGQWGLMQEANYGSSQDGPLGQVPSYQGNLNRAELETDYAPGQGKLESHAQPGQRGFLQDANYGSSQNGFFGQAPFQGDSDFKRAELEFNSAYGRGKLQSHAKLGQRGFLKDANNGSSQDGPFGQTPSYEDNFNRFEKQVELQRRPRSRGLLQDANNGSSQDGPSGQASSYEDNFNRFELQTNSAQGQVKLQRRPRPRDF